MKSNTDLMFAQRGVALLRPMTHILLRYAKDSPCGILTNFCKAISKFKAKIFELKPITPEYFEQLLSSDTSKINFIGDIKSCALISINSLAMSDVNSKSWVKLKIETELSDSPQSKNKKMNGMSDTSIRKNGYIIQCYGVSSFKEKFVLYVTYEKFFDILMTFHGSMSWDRSLMVEIDTSEFEVHQVIADAIDLSYVYCGIEIEHSDMEKMLQVHFRTPKYLRKNELFQIDVKKILPYLDSSVKYVNMKSIYFKVRHIASRSGTNDEFGYYVIGKRTTVKLNNSDNCYLPPKTTKFVYFNDKIFYEIPMCPAGLDKYFVQLQELFEIFLTGGDSNLKPMILLNGVKGSGKKTVLKCIAARFGMRLYSVNCFDFMRLDVSAFESKFHSLINNLERVNPAIFHLENVDMIAKDEKGKEDVSVTDVFQKATDFLFRINSGPVVLVGSCNQKIPDLVMSVERMFIQTVIFKPMREADAEKLLDWLVEEDGFTCSKEIVREVAARVNGYLFADIVKLIRIALKYQREDDTISGEERRLNMEHMEKAIGVVEGHYSAAIGSAKVPSVHWDDVGGLEKLKEDITLSLNLSTAHPELAGWGLRASGFLFYGPPGTGKTLMAKAVATEFNCSFLSVKGPELMNMYVGQSEKNVREVFERARDAAPCVIFFDELDSLAPNRGRDSGPVMDRIVSQLLTEMDGLESNAGVFVIGATNRPDLVDPGLLRPGRFDKMFYVGICSTKDMKLSVIKALTRKFSLADDVDFEALVDQIPAQVTGADLYSICSNSWLEAARRYIQKMNEGEKVELPVTVNMKDFEHGRANFVPSLTPEVIQSYDKFKELER